jgi:phytoene dehydrogenase-like protein
MSDAIVIGAGHNGLVAALFLAQAGRKVTVVERRDVVGGLCAGESFHEGYRTAGVLHDSSGVRREVVDALGLGRFGLAFEDAAASVLAAHPSHKGVLLHADATRSRAELDALAKGDGDGYAEWRAFVSRVRPFVKSLLDRKPPLVRPDSLAEMWSLGKTGLALRRLGKADMVELIRVAPMCAADWLGELFDNPLIPASLAAPAVSGAFVGPWAAGTAATLLMVEAAREREVKGGGAALVASLQKALEAAGGKIRTGTAVERIVVDNGAAKGVQLEGGESLAASEVVASCDPKTALLDLIAPGQLPFEIEEQMRVVRTRGTTARVALALDGPMVFRGREGERIARATVGADVDEVERAFDAAKYKSFAERPHLDVSVPSVGDASLAPVGKDVVTVLAHAMPYDLEGGWSDDARERAGDAVVAMLEEVAPGTADKIVAREVLTPVDLEARYGCAGGHIHHGEHVLDQLLFMRPSRSVSRYATPIAGLFLGGSGSHPGGGITGQPGALCAQAVLKG